jgi:hypothetical protein
MINVDQQIERLRRHYVDALGTYDEISLADMAHALRVLTEKPEDLISRGGKFGSSLWFKTAKPSRQLGRAAKTHEYVLCYLEGGVKTRAGTTRAAAFPVEAWHSEKMTSGIKARRTAIGMELASYCIIYATLPEGVKQHFLKTAGSEARRVSFQQWLQGEAVSVGFLNAHGAYEAQSIPRHLFIKVVANTLGGSHPSQNASAGHENRFAEAVHHLLKFQSGDLPLPYFILLKIAQDILRAAGEIQGDGSDT